MAASIYALSQNKLGLLMEIPHTLSVSSIPAPKGRNMQLFPSTPVTVKSNALNASAIHFVSAMFVRGIVKVSFDH
jgi:hypothetical protein